MALRDILVHAESSAQVHHRLAAAFALAQRHDAHVTGLAVKPYPNIPGFALTSVTGEILAHIEQMREQDLTAARSAFDRAARSAGRLERTSWLTEEGSAVEQLSFHARYADLVVIGQETPDGEHPDLPDNLVLACGRPVLVIPHAGAPKEIGRRILVGWNGSREAARAVADAMPLLEAATTVDVLAADGGGTGALTGADIALHLARHGIKVEAVPRPTGAHDPADVMLGHIADRDCDLLVIGAYGHSRLREIVLGGVTRHMLEHMTVPVLLSH